MHTSFLSKLVVSSLFILLSFFGISQNSCGFDDIHREQLKKDPNYKIKLDAFENYVRKDFHPSKLNGSYKVPVVVHVMETGTSMTDITDDQIKQAIKSLNQMYRKVTGTHGDGNGVDITIEFALAVRDPQGNCTNGINRFDMSSYNSYMTKGVNRKNSDGMTDAELKSLIYWDQTKYYNLWFISEIDDNDGGSGVQGYAYFATSHGSSTDGAVMLVNAMKKEDNNTLAHELGHALNLYHTFEGDQDNSGNSICPTNNDCTSDGDKVCDTPPHIRSKSDCVVGTNACDNNSSTENFIHNYMDYSSSACTNMFTDGQKTRMLAALLNYRTSLLEEYGNLSLTPVTSPTVDFTVSSSYLCTGGTISCFDNSSCLPNTFIASTIWTDITYAWTVTNGTNTQTSSLINPTFTLNNAGIYTITLKITTGGKEYESIKQGCLIVGNAPTASCTPSSQYEGNYWSCITNVSLHTLDNTTSIYENTAYTDFTCSKNTILEPGKSYSMNVSVRPSNYAETFEAYIDYNNDGVFSSTEKIHSGTAPADATNFAIVDFPVTITIPQTAVTNTPLRMRVYGENSSSISAGKISCGTKFYTGDVEDYTVYISSNVASVSIVASPSETTTYGSTTTFTASPINGGTNPTYKWYINGIEVTGQTSSVFSSSTLLDGDIVTCVLTSNLANVVSSPATSNAITMQVTGKPLSDFSVDKTTVCSGSSVSFTDISKLAPTSWSWTFAGGTPSSSASPNPTVTYSTPGKYAVTLTASNANGTGTTETKTDYITIYAQPTAICNSFSRIKSATAGIGITNVTFNTIQNPTAYNDAVYTDNTCTYTTFLEPSTSYPISINTGATNNQWLRVYIDYNGDGDFSDAGETVFSPSNGKSNFSGTITTPASPTMDKILRMRVITDFTNTSAGSCTNSIEYGQVEDYGVVFKTMTCDAPQITSQPNTPSATCDGNGSQTLSVVATGSNLTYQWRKDGQNISDNTVYSGATSATLTLSKPTSNEVGSYDVVVSGSCNPSVTSSSVNVSVTQAPSVNTTTGTNAACVNATSQLSNSTSNGVWATSDTQIASVSSTGLVTAISEGTTTITYTVGSTGCMNSDSFSFTSIANPTVSAITGANEVCENSTTQLSNTTNGGVWSSVNANLSVNSSGLVTGVSKGNGTIEYTLISNGCTSKTSVSITVNTPTTIDSFFGSTDYCVGDTGSYIVSPENGVFTSSNPTVGNVFGTGEFSANQGGTTTLTYTISSGGCTTVESKTITVNGKTTPTFAIQTSYCISEQAANLSATSDNSISGSWKPSSISTVNSGTTSYIFTPNNGECASVVSLPITISNLFEPQISCGTSTENSVTFQWTSESSISDFDLSYSINGQSAVTSNTQATTITVSGLKENDAVVLTVTPKGTGCYTPASGTCTAIKCIPASINHQTESSLSMCELDTANIFVSTNNSSAIQWQISSDGGNVWSDISDLTSYQGITSDTLQILGSTSINSTIYRAKIDGSTPSCPIYSSSVFLIVNSLPSAQFTTKDTLGCLPYAVIFTNNSNNSNGENAWDFGNGVTIENSIGQFTYTYSDAGTFQPSLTTSLNGCSSTFTLPTSIQVNNCAGIEENVKNSITIFPNPTSNVLNVSGIQGATHITILDLTGRKLMEEEISTKESLTLEISSLQAGSYFVEFHTNGNEKSRVQFIKN
jgi:PKD repeat protein